MSSKNKKNLIEFTDPVLHGTVSVAMAKCGKKECRCRKDDAYLHGPYYRWTGLIDGKQTTVTLSKEEAEECRRRIQNWKRLQDKIALLAQKSLGRAPWTDREKS